MATITSANSVLTLAVNGLFPVPQVIQGYAVDDAFEGEAVQQAEILMGVDGVLSAGKVFVPYKMTIHLQADSPSIFLFDAWRNAQDAAVDVLITKTLRAVKEFGAKSISLSGGVAANKVLRSTLTEKAKNLNLQFFVPGQGLCTDNAEMIGLAAAFMLKNGYKPKSYKNLKADSNLVL